ncbi:MAG: DUF1016 family protein [Muribaculaceae bacterium]|nr:DUF1016 family protein [Muribaculaceae bacterium]
MEDKDNVIKIQDNQLLSAQLVNDVKLIVERGLSAAYHSVNSISILTYWNVGKRIVEEEQHGENRAEYGKQVLKGLARVLVPLFGSSYSERNLYSMRQFFLYFNDLEILNSRVQNLSWTHYRMLLRVPDEDARYWYLREASEEMWSSRTLSRNIGSQYYYRLLKSPKKDKVIAEMRELTQPLQQEKDEIVKNPVVAEFLGLENTDYSESELEQAIIAHLQKFILEMGRGFAYMGRQQLIRTDTQDYYIDLVFYNVILKCYVLIDLKVGVITHQDVGQMDMYVRMYDELRRTEGDNPTIGIVLCSETSKDIARYSILKGNEQLFAAKYLPMLPSEEMLRHEIEQQKEIFYLQHKEPNSTNAD